MQTRAICRRGLSLIEVLVLASVLSFVAATLGPAIAKHQGDSQRTHELDNLRVLAQLMAKYSADDPLGTAAPVHPVDRFFYFTGYMGYGGGPGTMPFLGWGMFSDPPTYTDQMPYDPRTRPLNFYLYGRDAISPTSAPGDLGVFKPFQCLGDDRGWQNVPGFNGDARESEPNSYFSGDGTSFRMNNLAFNNNVYAGIVGRPIGRIPEPSQTLTLMEARAFETAFTNSAIGELGPVQLTGNHKKPGYFMTTYVDGHGSFADFGVNSYYPSTTVGPFAYIDTRGTWGRMDCLPDPPMTSNGVNPGVSPALVQDKTDLTSLRRSPAMSAMRIQGDALP